MVFFLFILGLKIFISRIGGMDFWFLVRVRKEIDLWVNRREIELGIRRRFRGRWIGR